MIPSDPIDVAGLQIVSSFFGARSMMADAMPHDVADELLFTENRCRSASLQDERGLNRDIRGWFVDVHYSSCQNTDTFLSSRAG